MKPVHEYILFVFNRAAAPASFFLALTLIERVSSPEDFSEFLVLYAISQWVLTSLFQWQKNTIIVFFDSRNIYEVSIRVILFSSFICIFLFLVYSIIYGSKDYLGISLFCIAVGLNYSFGSVYRMRFSVKRYVFLDTLFHSFKWLGFIILYFIFRDIFAGYIGMSVVLVVPVIIYIITIGSERKNSNIESENNSDNIELFDFLKFGVYLFVFDFISSGFMYIDRIVASDPRYILPSTIGNQIATVVFGAYISYFFPAVKKEKIKNNDWKGFFLKGFKYNLYISVFVVLVSFAFGPFVQKIIAPSVEIDLSLIILCAIGQVILNFIYYLFVYIRLSGEVYWATFVFFVIFVFYSSLLLLFDSGDLLMIASSRVLFLFICFIIIGCIVLNKIRK